jgi:hypothetical protein
MSIILLLMVYAYAASTAVLLVASGYVPGSWLAAACSDRAFLCEYPWFAFVPLAMLMAMYRWSEQRGAPIRHPLLRRLKAILD